MTRSACLQLLLREWAPESDYLLSWKVPQATQKLPWAPPQNPLKKLGAPDPDHLWWWSAWLFFKAGIYTFE